MSAANPLTAKDFVSDQEVKWCPGCGDYSILKQMQSILPDIGVPKEKIVFVSGIGCSSRFPYYMNTYGLHSIHGRAPAVAMGLKIANPELNIWMITGDGDSLSIGGNHTIHLLRRNVDINVLLFNNEIYGLTKGQYSPTSEKGLKTKSSPMGSLDHPFNPLALALGAESTFVARAMDRDVKHLREMLIRAQQHKGTSFLEIYQNCIIFNDEVFSDFTEKTTKPLNTIFVENGKPLIFDNGTKGIKIEGIEPKVINLIDGTHTIDEVLVHNEYDRRMAEILVRFFGDPKMSGFPRVFGVIYSEQREVFEDLLHDQIDYAIKNKKEETLDDILSGGNTWEVA